MDCYVEIHDPPPVVVQDDDIAAAKAMLKAIDITAKDVAKRLGVSVPTLYRYLPAARAVITHANRLNETPIPFDRNLCCASVRVKKCMKLKQFGV